MNIKHACIFTFIMFLAGALQASKPYSHNAYNYLYPFDRQNTVLRYPKDACSLGNIIMQHQKKQVQQKFNYALAYFNAIKNKGYFDLAAEIRNPKNYDAGDENPYFKIFAIKECSYLETCIIIAR